MGIPAAGQHADGFAGPRKVLQELSKGALAVGGNVVGHGEKSGDCAEPGAQQAVCPARARLRTTAPRARRSPMGGPRPTQAAGPGRGTAGGGALQWEGRSGARPRKKGGHLRLGGIAAEARALRARGGVYGGGRCIAEGEQLRQEGGRAPQVGGALRGRGQHVREAPQVGGPEAQRRRTLRFAQDSSQCSVSSRGRPSFTSGSPRFLLRAEVSGKHVWRILRLKASMGVPVPTGPYGGREGMRPPYSRPGASGSGEGAGKAGKGDKTPVLT